MSTALMRALDYWLGIPLCFLLTGADRISRLMGFTEKRKGDALRKILFIKLSEMGAIILSYPLIQSVKEEYPGSEAFFLTFERNRDVFASLGAAVEGRNILTIRERSIPIFLLDVIRAIRRMRKEKLSLAIDLDFFSRFTAALAYLSGARERIGFSACGYPGLYRGDLFTHNTPFNPSIHIRRAYLSLWQTFKGSKEEPGTVLDNSALPRFIPDDFTRCRIERMLHSLGVDRSSRVFLLSPGEGALPVREWPLENFVELSRKILEDPKNYIILIGIERNARKPKLLCAALRSKRCINLTGLTSIPELLAICDISRALIASDGGLAHLASLTPVNKFIIFGPESPEVFGPLGNNTRIIYSGLPCSPCLSALNQRKSSCRHKRCLKMINSEDIFELVRQVP